MPTEKKKNLANRLWKLSYISETARLPITSLSNFKIAFFVCLFFLISRLPLATRHNREIEEIQFSYEIFRPFLRATSHLPLTQNPIHIPPNPPSHYKYFFSLIIIII